MDTEEFNQNDQNDVLSDRRLRIPSMKIPNFATKPKMTNKNILNGEKKKEAMELGEN